MRQLLEWETLTASRKVGANRGPAPAVADGSGVSRDDREPVLVRHPSERFQIARREGGACTPRLPGEPISANIPSIPAGEYMNSMRAALSPALLK